MAINPTPFRDIPLDNVKGVLLDLDNTLFEHESCHQAGLQATYDALNSFGLTIDYEGFKKAYQVGRNSVQNRLMPQGACRSRLLYFQAMLEHLQVSSHLTRSLELENAYISNFLKKMTLFPEAKKFIQRCKQQKIALCVITNLTSQFQFKKLIQLDIETEINYIMTSEEAGVEKPDPAMFNLALSKLNLSKDDVIMVGDNQDHDIKGALNMGISAYLISHDLL